ncbi:MAG: TIGR03643 family protein [Pseudomonadota bacterium]
MNPDVEIRPQTRITRLFKNSSNFVSELTRGDISAAIQMAWEDRTSFETIQERLGLTEPQVTRLMRRELTRQSFELWRARMKGRLTKHRSLRSQEMPFHDRAVADHRRANC